MFDLCITKLLLRNCTRIIFTLIIAFKLSDSTNFRINPTFGPIAGGTLVELIGDWSASSSPYVIYFSNSTISVDVNTQMSRINVKSPSAAGTGSHVISVQGNGVSVQSDTEFVYRENPVISAILPLRHSALGKTVVTVYGRSLNSVAYPMIHTLVTVTRPDPAHPGETTTSMTLDTPEPCSTVNDLDPDHLLCPMPDLNLPQDFIDKLNEDVISNSGAVPTRKRRSPPSQIKTVKDFQDNYRVKRDVIVSRLTGADGSFADVRIAFELDGVEDYKNGIDLRDKLEFLIPTCDLDTESTIIVNRPSEKHLNIKGAHFLRVGSVDDYEVFIGQTKCFVTDVTDNVISCIPSVTSQLINNSRNECPGSLSVHVQFTSKLRCFYGCLRYNDATNTSFLIAVTVGTILPFIILLVIVIIFILVCCKRLKRSKEISNQEQRASELSFQSTNSSKPMVVKSLNGTLDRGRKNFSSSKKFEGGSELENTDSDFRSNSEKLQGLFELRGIPNRENVTSQYRYSAYQTDGSLPRNKRTGDEDQYGDGMHSNTADIKVLQASVASDAYRRSIGNFKDDVNYDEQNNFNENEADDDNYGKF